MKKVYAVIVSEVFAYEENGINYIKLFKTMNKALKFLKKEKFFKNGSSWKTKSVLGKFLTAKILEREVIWH